MRVLFSGNRDGQPYRVELCHLEESAESARLAFAKSATLSTLKSHAIFHAALRVVVLFYFRPENIDCEASMIARVNRLYLWHLPRKHIALSVALFRRIAVS